MIYNNVTRVDNQAHIKVLKVFYTGTDAISKGEGVCFDRDYDDGTDPADAADAWMNRCIYVAAPSATNNNSFAGVVLNDYTAKSTGQWIEIALPGSICLAKVVDSSVTIGDTSYVWCLAGASANAGQWTAVTTGFMGKGCARVMQTLTAAGLCLVELIQGPDSGLVEVIPTATLTAGGAITCMVGGTTYFDGPATPASDCTFTIAAGTYLNQGKYFDLDGALTTNDVLITVNGEQLDGTTDLATVELDADNDAALLSWGGVKWQLTANSGPTLA